MITGFFILFGISPMEFTENIFKKLISKPRSIKDEINETTKRKKISFLRREIMDVQEILKVTGREKRFPMLCAFSLLLFAMGGSIAIMLGNFFLVPVMAIGFMFLPFWYIRLTQSYFKRDIAAELETALSIITSAYLRNEDILTAVEENMNYLNPPVLSVFKGFVSRIKLINPDIMGALQAMKEQIDNAVFREWCDALIACQLDRSLKTTLTPIVGKLSDMRVVNGELENMVFEPRKEFITMVILVIGNIPLLYFLNKDWYHTLMHSALGQIILSICAMAIFISTAFVIKLTQPIEYRR
jgi:Flp pilus assembly protein TadB